MEQILFSNSHLKTLMIAEKITESKEYLSKFFYSSLGQIFFYDGHKFILKKIPDAKLLISNDCKIEIKQANEQTQKFEKITYRAVDFLSESMFMDKNYQPDIDYKISDLIFTKNNRIRGIDYKENFINMAKEMRFSKLDLKEFNEKLKLDENKRIELKEKLKMVYTHIFEVLCSSDEICYEYVLNWLSCTFNGRKLMTLLYLQSTERTGKGIIINDLIKKLFGECMHKTNSVEEITKYNKQFEGCKLLNFDEVPMATEFKTTNDAIKYLTTEPTFPCRDMYSSAYTQKNTFNIIMTSNNNCLLFTQNSYERNVCLEISECKKGEQFIEYFVKLGKIIDDDDVKMLFQQDMNDRYATLGDWNENKKPMTATKKVKIIEGLPKFYKYMKDQFIMKKIDLNLDTKKFFAEYALITKDNTSTNQLGKYLRTLGIEGKRQSDNNGYKYIKTWRDMLKIYREKLWIDELVDLIDDSKDVEDCEEVIEINIIKNLEDENKMLKMQLEEYKKLHVDYKPIIQHIVKETPIIIEDIQVIDDDNIIIIDDIDNTILTIVKPDEIEVEKEIIKKKTIIKKKKDKDIIVDDAEQNPKIKSQKELSKYYDNQDKNDKKKQKLELKKLIGVSEYKVFDTKEIDDFF